MVDNYNNRSSVALWLLQFHKLFQAKILQTFRIQICQSVSNLCSKVRYSFNGQSSRNFLLCSFKRTYNGECQKLIIIWLEDIKMCLLFLLLLVPSTNQSGNTTPSPNDLENATLFAGKLGNTALESRMRSKSGQGSGIYIAGVLGAMVVLTVLAVLFVLRQKRRVVTREIRRAASADGEFAYKANGIFV